MDATPAGIGQASAYLEGLEAFFGCSVTDVAVHLREALTKGPSCYAATRFDEFLDTYAAQLDQMNNTGLLAMPSAPEVLARQVAAEKRVGRRGPLGHLEVLDPGETRPLLMLRLGDRSPWGKRYPAGDAKTVLLYSREVVLMDPTLAHTQYWTRKGTRAPSHTRLSKAEASRAWRARYADRLRGGFALDDATLEGLSREEWLVRSVEQLAALSPAIRAGFVDSIFVDPKSPWSAWRPGEE